jgi:pantetheine hydrolase
MKSVLIILLTAVQFFISSANYIAAVVEHEIYYGAEGDSSEQILDQNIELYEEFINLARMHKVQVIVFPEFGLTPVDVAQRSDLYPFAEQVPEVDENTSYLPCGNPSFSKMPILSRMSCAAKSGNMLTLVNMVDSVLCSVSTDSLCPSDGMYLYNVNVLFDENGYLVRKYHKSNEWPGLIDVGYDQPPEPSYVTYTSSFGVLFGTFTCFDIMWEDPPKVLRSRGVEHFLYPVKQGKIGETTLIEPWSKNNNAVVLSANLGSGKLGDCSGIVVNGTAVETTKYYLNNLKFRDENILVGVVPV